MWMERSWSSCYRCIVVDLVACAAIDARPASPFRLTKEVSFKNYGLRLQ
jgi:hypothetical protein